MNSPAFDRAFSIVITHEGSYVNNPADPGGETKYGISKRAYPGIDIAALTLEKAQRIYRRDYWNKCRCGELHDPNVALLVFDCAVNSGVRAAGLDLQHALGRVGQKVSVDGVIGPVTVAATNAANPGELCTWLLALRGQRFGNIALSNPVNWSAHSLGWMRRLAELAKAVA